MAARRRITARERRARLARRHHLAPAARAGSPVGVARDLVGIHSTDPRTVFLSLWARMRAVDVGTVERALYDERTLVRMLGMRRTLFVVPADLVPVLQAACSTDIARRERKRLVQVLERAGVSKDPARWLRDAERRALRAIADRGEVAAAEVSKADPRLATRVLMAPGTRFEAEVSVTSRVLTLLSIRGRIVRGRPRGTWVSSQYRWSLAERWLPEGLPHLTSEQAQAELIRRWLGAFGPGTTRDIRWWTGLTAREVARALHAIGPVEVDLDAGTGLVLPDDLGPVRAPRPWAALLPPLDSTVMGWAERSWYLGDHAPALFDRAGNSGPTVWWDGRVVGGWGQRPEGEVVVRLLEDVGADAATAVEAEAERLKAWLGEVRLASRFPTPLERELSAGRYG